MNNSKQLTIFCAGRYVGNEPCCVRKTRLGRYGWLTRHVASQQLVVVRQTCFVGDSRLLLEPLYI